MNPRLVLNLLRSLGRSWILSTALFKTTGWLGNCSCCQPWAEKSCAQTGRLREELRGHVWLFSILSLNIKQPPPRDPRGWKWVCTKELEPQSSLQVRNCIQSSNLLASSCQSKNTICQLFFVSWGLGTVFLMFKNLFYFFKFMCICMCMYVICRSPRTEGAGTCELSNMGAKTELRFSGRALSTPNPWHTFLAWALCL